MTTTKPSLRQRLAQPGLVVAPGVYDMVSLRLADGSLRTMSPRHLVFATGVSAMPVMPRLPGLENFAGTVLHSGAFTEGAAWRGRRALVLGTAAGASPGEAGGVVESSAPEVPVAEDLSKMAAPAVTSATPPAAAPAAYAPGKRCMKRATFTAPRRCVPSPILRSPSCASTANSTLRSSTSITVAVATTVRPTGVAAR